MRSPFLGTTAAEFGLYCAGATVIVHMRANQCGPIKRSLISSLNVDSFYMMQMPEANRFALHQAAADGLLPQVAAILETPAGPRLAALHDRDIDGCTPLYLAAGHGRVTVMAWLLRSPHAKIALSISDLQGNVPLHAAAYFGHATAAVRLLEASPSMYDVINLQNSIGATPLMYAAQMGHVSVVEALLKVPGCRLDLEATDGNTALTLAADGPLEAHKQVYMLLLAAWE